jgi:1-acyl-sn-glycerol-3-phosphate acyltransferase
MGARPGFWYQVASGALRPPVRALSIREWQGVEHLPTEGGFVVAANHISYFDPFEVGLFLDRNHYPVRFMAKSELFDIPIAGRIVRGAGQIPVYRGSAVAASAYRDAVAAVESGECVVVYPEGTITRDPDMWPMTAKTGAARIALTTGAPVIPIAQWGAQEVLPPYSKKLKIFSRTVMHVHAGQAVDLSEFMPAAGTEPSGSTLRAATTKIMDAITELLEGIRGGKAPAVRFDSRQSGVTDHGNPNKRRTGSA